VSARADIEALDRGVIETGLVAAEALARVKALEARLGELVAALDDRFAGHRDAVAGLIGAHEELSHGRRPAPPPRHLSAVPPNGGQQ